MKGRDVGREGCLERGREGGMSGRRKEEGGRRKEEGGRRKEEGGRRKEEGGRRKEAGRQGGREAGRQGGREAEMRGREGEREEVSSLIIDSGLDASNSLFLPHSLTEIKTNADVFPCLRRVIPNADLRLIVNVPHS